MQLVCRASCPYCNAHLCLTMHLANADTPSMLCTETSQCNKQQLQQELSGLRLQPLEAEAAMLQCCWLAHYWVRMMQRGALH